MQSNSKNINLAVVDDHKIVISGINGVIETSPDIEMSITATDAQDLIQQLEHQAVDVIIMDINMPDTDGMELCKIVKKAYPKTKVIGLTTFSQVSFIAQMLRNGADGYLFKNTSEEELIEAIQTVHNGEQYLSKEVNQKLVLKAMSKSASEKSFIPKLSRRENEVLQLIAEEYTNQEIADKLFLSVSTIETHRMNLCSKLEVRNTAGLVRKAIKFGFIE